LTVNFKVIGPDHPIMASAGEDALLPCHLSPSMSAQKMEVRWYQFTSSEPVHLYQDGKDHPEQQIPNYWGRTELLKDGIVDGSVVLHIRNITPFDHGQFICSFQSDSFYAEAVLELKVSGLGSTPRISIDSYQSGGIHMVCESAGWYPEPQVQWRDLSGKRLPSLTEKITQSDNGLFEAQISIIATETSIQDLSCSVRNSHLNPWKESVVYIADPFFLRGYPWKVAVYILLVVVGFLTFTASYFFWKQHKAKVLCRLCSICTGLSSFLTSLSPSLIAAHVAEKGITEAWWNEDNEWDTVIPGYKIYRKDRAGHAEVKVTLDPSTANPGLKLSKDLKTVTWQSKPQVLCDNLKRFDQVSCVLGSEGFTSGRIYWEVEEMGRIWVIGVARESVRRKEQIKFTPKEGIWGLEQTRDHYSLLTAPESPLRLSEPLEKVRIYVNYETEQVTFFNPDNGDLIASLTASFTGEKIFPFFWV
ncbi:Butyrophilin subfamily 3 member A3, partial [Chelonia mydas]